MCSWNGDKNIFKRQEAKSNMPGKGGGLKGLAAMTMLFLEDDCQDIGMTASPGTAPRLLRVERRSVREATAKPTATAMTMLFLGRGCQDLGMTASLGTAPR
jgi:hypothetical protein